MNIEGQIVWFNEFLIEYPMWVSNFQYTKSCPPKIFRKIRNFYTYD